ncbi:hypothetical protein [Pseudoxanthomonas wuyuanensis]|uniref:hypothetical protein n=1 Tax=Pseudoxanthomonas wuyuanensis TaxID=1073196 RepID=UPI001141B435|nr:hypothetical protein [Pseudoxanthomonas wuyuanensis]
MKASANWQTGLALPCWSACAAPILLGAATHTLYFSSAFLFAGLALMASPKSVRLGLCAIVFGLAYFLLVFGYGVGSDLALRSAPSPASSAHSWPSAESRRVVQTGFAQRCGYLPIPAA